MSASSADLLALIRQAIASGGDADRAVQQQRYMKSPLPYRGFSSPDLRRTLRPILDAHPLADQAEVEAVVRGLWGEAAWREEWYAAIAVLRHRAHRQWLDPAALDLLRHLVETGAWWDVVDELAQHCVGTVLLHHRDEVTPMMLAWSMDTHLWVRRTAVLSQNRHRAVTDPDLLRQVLDANLDDSPHGREFFIRKAVGWALREYAHTDPEWVIAYVSQRSALLSGLSRREALKHVG